MSGVGSDGSQAFNTHTAAMLKKARVNSLLIYHLLFLFYSFLYSFTIIHMFSSMKEHYAQLQRYRKKFE
jgi:hypothetical protein